MFTIPSIPKKILLATTAFLVCAGPANALDLGATLQGVTGTTGQVKTPNGNDHDADGGLTAGLRNATHILGGVQANRSNGNNGNEGDDNGVSGLKGLIGADSNSLVALKAQDKTVGARVVNANNVTLQGTATHARRGNNTLSDALDNMINLKGFEQADHATVKNGKIVLGSATDVSARADKNSAKVALDLDVAGAVRSQNE